MKLLFNITKYLSFFAIIIAVNFPSCNTEVGNPDPSPIPGKFSEKAIVKLSIQGTKPLSNTASIRLLRGLGIEIDIINTNGVFQGKLYLTQARLALKDINLKLASTELDEKDEDYEEKYAENEKINFNGPFIVDLINNSIYPQPQTTEVIPGLYQDIAMSLNKLTGEEKDKNGQLFIKDPNDPLIGNSIYITGLYTGKTSTINVTNAPFFLTFDFDETFNLSSISMNSLGFRIEKDIENSIIIAFRLNKWFNFQLATSHHDDDEEEDNRNLDFNSLELSKDSLGKDIILLNSESSSNNKRLREIIKNNIKASADYGKDENHDGKLEKEEDDDPDEEDVHDD